MSSSSLVGQTLGHYRIESTIGEGGMGVVYRALDLRLDRQVAVKVLRPEALGDPDRKQRFVREAKAASALNHPNIIIIHEISEQDGMRYIVMEYVPGQTLHNRIDRAPLSTRDTLDFALQISDALTRAHSAGIIHRDIKPENIIVGDDGRVKVLDFGLAKLVEQTEPASRPTSSDWNGEGTMAGSVLGTAEYMSPEQAMGSPSDARSDIFAFGAVLYEMLTGRRAFEAQTKWAAMKLVMNQDPQAPSELNRMVDPALEEIAMRCLQKSPADRFQKMDQVRAAIDRQLQSARHRPARRAFWALGGIAALALIVMGADWGMARWKAAHRALEVMIPVTAYAGVEIEPAISADGTKVAFIYDGDDGESRNLYVKPVDGDALRLTNHAAVDSDPVWSPDGKQIAFLSKQPHEKGFEVMVTAASGGDARRIGMAGLGLDWSPVENKLIAIEPGAASGFRVFDLVTGQPQLIATPDAYSPDRLPRFSPDGRRIAYVHFQDHGSAIYTIAASGGKPHQVHWEKRGISGLAWTSDGQSLVYSWSIPWAQPSMFRIPAEGGVPEPVANQAHGPSIARHADRMAFELVVLNQNIWSITIPESGRPRQLISSSHTNTDMQYCRDGNHIVFASTRSGSSEIWMADAEGRHEKQLTNMPGKGLGSPSCSPDNKQVAFDSQANIYRVSLDGSQPVQMTSTEAAMLPGWTPDEKWIFYSSNRSGTRQIWRQAATGGEPVQITKQGGFEAKISADGKTLYYSKRPSESSTLWSVSIEGMSEGPLPGMPEEILNRQWDLTEKGIYFFLKDDPKIRFYDFQSHRVTVVAQIDQLPRGATRNFAVSPDGRRVLWAQVDNDTKDISVLDHFR